LTAVVTGDLNGDGASTITDMLMVKSAVLGNSLSEIAAIAGDVNYDGKATITDFLQMKAYLLKLGAISAGKAAGIEPKDPLILLIPGETKTWTVDGAVSYVADETIAAVTASGAVTAGSAEGSAFVYALDADGEVLSRAIVTVLDEKLSVSIGAESHRLIRGETLTLSSSFNHPVTPAVTWTSSDSKVVSVDADGKITTPGNGTAVVTATLENGSKAETTITVVPPITSIKIERSLYKVKPGASRTIPVALEPAETGEELIWTSSDTSVAKVSADGTVTGIKNGTVTITVKGKYSGLKASCKVKVCNVKQVAITFDDGPSIYTADLLTFLEQNDIRATFFLVGNRVNRYSETVKRIGAGGHELGYHSYNHVSQPSLSSKQVTSEYKLSNSEVKKLTGRPYTVWRTPGGGYNERVLNCVPLPHIMWSVDTLDWQTMRTDAVYRAVKTAKDGSIILLHDLYKTSVNGAIKAMKEMNAGDYEFLTVTELLSRKGTAPKPSTNYYNG
jgi:peptidoglycan/xylan/chitin deacetylase (PgdA/CDA1 family)